MPDIKGTKELFSESGVDYYRNSHGTFGKCGWNCEVSGKKNSSRNLTRLKSKPFHDSSLQQLCEQFIHSTIFY